VAPIAADHNGGYDAAKYDVMIRSGARAKISYRKLDR
jgi:hypothetical protein